LGPSIAPIVPEAFQGNSGVGNPAYESGGGYNGARTPGRDVFFFSPVHYALVLYVARRIVESDEIGFPIIGHPALIGSY